MAEAAGPYALWLLPAPEQAQVLQALIERLAERYEAPAFAPHVTLCAGDRSGALEPWLEATATLASRLAPLELATAGPAWCDDFFTFFYLLLPDPAAAELLERARLAFPGSDGPPLGPHLSLLYAEPEQGQPGAAIDRAALARELAPELPARLSFDSLALVRPGPGGWRHGWPWRVEGRFRLGAA
ncbi:2'-5' RNA ligase family protein [Cyanobium sp. ATX 6F1]|uniref:2'-5' RNA ligase family protein n=1 Tax=unclassified Cyanobium TaxID=2627006 RepID=UPI0020CBB454|nr:2'-5' RNA ligase family protein [Cyanobium sp. ATX 6F1]MCP9916304.1 hypothetical protein [Cyanobium sp. ATX 6F1]